MEIFEEIKIWSFIIIFFSSLIALFLSLFRTSKIINLKKLKSDDLKSRDFLIGAILNLTVIASYAVDERELGFSMVMLNVVAYVYLRMYTKIRYKLLDEMESLLFYKALAKSGTLFAFLMFYIMSRNENFKIIIANRLDSFIFPFIYIFMFNLTAFFTFRKNEKMVEKSNENH